jgi:prepilin-type N-terminal cleavage/methylation domain-containing protein
LTEQTARGVKSRAGFSLLEMVISSTLLAVILMASFALIERNGHLSVSTLGIAAAEQNAQRMLYSLERELADARGANPKASVTADLMSGQETSLAVDSTLGFPPYGTLLLERDTDDMERLSYASLGPNLLSFDGLERALACTNNGDHFAGLELLWDGLAEPIELQASPPANLFDGRVMEFDGIYHFRGNGSGFSYRVPVDPAGGMDYLDGNSIRWGAVVDGVPTETGWYALIYQPQGEVSEVDLRADINDDGDQDDVFDVGQIRRLAWDTTDPGGPVDDHGLGPSVVLQERCGWGNDLDGDGFEDPIFYWDRDRRILHLRLVIIGRARADSPVIRRVEASVFLRNDAEDS